MNFSVNVEYLCSAIKTELIIFFQQISLVPARLANPASPVAVTDLIVVGSVDYSGTPTGTSSRASYMTIWAPGWRYFTPWWQGQQQAFSGSGGTSGGKPSPFWLR